MTRVMTGFTPRQHGFHFGNSFNNEIFNNFLGSWTTKGRCGGMAFASLDYYYAGRAVPAHTGDCFPNGKVPEDSSGLAGYIWDRLMDSFAANGIKFATWSLKRDHSTLVWGEGVPQLTKNEEFPRLMNVLKNGPAALGLINTQNVFEIGDNHQVVAYGAELDEATGKMTVYVYDNNYPDSEIILTSNPNDLYFTSNLTYATGGHPRYRGFFVEDYSRKTPSYTDLVISRGLITSSYNLGLGGSLGASFAVKNYGSYPAPLASLFLGVTGPGGEKLDYFFSGDSQNTPIQPGEERVYNKRCEEFGKTTGVYTLKAAYKSMQEIVIYNLPAIAISSTGSFYSPAGEAAVKVEGFSGRVTAVPPFVEKVEVIYADPGAGYARSKYRGEWLFQSAQRTLQRYSEPIAPGFKTLHFNIRFSSPGGMKSETVRLNLTGRSPVDNSYINIPVALTGRGQDFTGSWKPENRYQKDYSLTLEIQGSDDYQRFSSRTPGGNMIDSDPSTVVTADLSRPPYPFLNYEPGTDRKHSIQIAVPVMSLNPDPLENNNDFPSATRVLLDRPEAQALQTAQVKSMRSFGSLTLHNSIDTDYFNVTFQSLPEDDTCLLEGPVSQTLSPYLGLSATTYPPLVWVRVDNLDDGFTDLVVYKSDKYNRSTVQTGVKSSFFRLYNPLKTFPDKSYYVQVKNTGYAVQGALKYGIEFGYMPVVIQTEVDHNAPAYRPLTEVRYRLIKRLVEALDLPRPADSILSRVSGRDLTYQSGGMVVTDMKVLIQKVEGFLVSADTVNDLKLVSRNEYESVMAAEYFSLAKAARSAGITAVAEQFYTESSSRFGKIGSTGDVIKVQSALKELQSAGTVQRINTNIIGRNIIR